MKYPEKLRRERINDRHRLRNWFLTKRKTAHAQVVGRTEEWGKCRLSVWCR